MFREARLQDRHPELVSGSLEVHALPMEVHPFVILNSFQDPSRLTRCRWRFITRHPELVSGSSEVRTLPMEVLKPVQDDEIITLLFTAY